MTLEARAKECFVHQAFFLRRAQRLIRKLRRFEATEVTMVLPAPPGPCCHRPFVSIWTSAQRMTVPARPSSAMCPANRTTMTSSRCFVSRSVCAVTACRAVPASSASFAAAACSRSAAASCVRTSSSSRCSADDSPVCYKELFLSLFCRELRTDLVQFPLQRKCPPHLLLESVPD